MFQTSSVPICRTPEGLKAWVGKWIPHLSAWIKNNDFILDKPQRVHCTGQNTTVHKYNLYGETKIVAHLEVRRETGSASATTVQQKCKCVYPLYIINSIDYFWPEFSIAEATLWAVVLSHMSCALNPLIYAYGMPGFRKAFREFFNIHAEENVTAANYSYYMRSSVPSNIQGSLKDWISSYPESLRKISAPTPIVKRSLKSRHVRRRSIDVIP